MVAQASPAPFALPDKRLRMRIPVWPKTAVFGIVIGTTTAVPAVEVVEIWVHSEASKVPFWLKSIHTDIMLLAVLVTLRL